MSSLFWLIVVVCALLISWLTFLILSSCVGPPLVRLFRSWLAQHYRATKSTEWDAGGGGYREPLGRSRTQAQGFEYGRGGAEGFEMSSMGTDDY